MRKILVIVATLALFSAAAYGQTQYDEMRGFMFQVGLGAASIEYPPDLDAMIDLVDAMGADRFTIYLDLGLGFAITQKTYVLFSISGVGDRLDYAGDYVQFNTYLYGVGVRHYPFTTGLVFGADLGAARMVWDDSSGGSYASDWGNGVRLFLGYDFARRLRGFTGILGLAVTGSTIEDEDFSSAQIFFSLAWK